MEQIQATHLNTTTMDFFIIFDEKTGGTRVSWYLRHRESCFLEVRIADHCLKFYEGSKGPIPSHCKVGLVRKGLPLFWNPVFVPWKFMKKLENFLAHTGFPTGKKKQNNKQWVCPAWEQAKLHQKNLLFPLLSTNPESSSLNHYPQSTFKGGVPQEYFFTPIQCGIFLGTYTKHG